MKNLEVDDFIVIWGNVPPIKVLQSQKHVKKQKEGEVVSLRYIKMSSDILKDFD